MAGIDTPFPPDFQRLIEPRHPFVETTAPLPPPPPSYTP